MRAFYSTQGEALLARSLPCDPESYDVDAPAVCEVTVSVLLAGVSLFFRADPFTLWIRPLDSQSSDVFLESNGPYERIPLGTNRHLNGAATYREAARLLTLTACSECGPFYPHRGCTAARDGAAFLVGEPSGDINEEQTYAAGRR